ncbi:hypothetical protein L226DRAFT_576170 [Lentinus tigrinus ALCF2SS1-7]|uniref:Cytochrome c oxidase subunit 8, mitochondrial n=1 Tax=Lentinus tigrinus ALCF2SS1-6 TaxID=1328759 RepID=A0A5C2RTE3_9APHY|nr:hypothetical protein L227DRAFT_616720 [Lentinus tigrinus ALCF2SS1-6]RPD68696.1 hypothetical protein L226DRAFT_576170 [Lentinus tigrinus ALCF2SS1-7]
MSPLVRVAPATLRVALRRTPQQVRTITTTGQHVAHSNFPFSYANKKSFAAKYVGTLGTLFLVPFIAVGYQLHKSGGSA